MSSSSISPSYFSAHNGNSNRRPVEILSRIAAKVAAFVSALWVSFLFPAHISIPLLAGGAALWLFKSLSSSSSQGSRNWSFFNRLPPYFRNGIVPTQPVRDPEVHIALAPNAYSSFHEDPSISPNATIGNIPVKNPRPRVPVGSSVSSTFAHPSTLPPSYSSSILQSDYKQQNRPVTKYPQPSAPPQQDDSKQNSSTHRSAHTHLTSSQRDSEEGKSAQQPNTRFPKNRVPVGKRK